MLSKLERKRAEIWHAGTFDGAVAKQDLLAAYLNQIEFGGREIVGLYRATRHYFRKEPKDLNLFEAAMLAGMVQAPARFNPLKEATRERAYERAKLVLELMVKQGRITKAEHARALQLGVRPGVMPEFKIQVQPFNEWVVQTWASKFVKEGETVRFFVTLEPRFQRIAEKQLATLVTSGAVPPEYEAGAVMMTGDGRVRAMIGAVDWSRSFPSLLPRARRAENRIACHRSSDHSRLAVKRTSRISRRDHVKGGNRVLPKRSIRSAGAGAWRTQGGRRQSETRSRSWR
jgi:penicillin-binding protein 1A